MRTVLVIIFVAITFVNAERKSNFTKPIINLDKRPRLPVWNRAPEERRKLSIFPKTNMKFVVTPKPVQNDNVAKEGLSTKRPIMRKFVMQDKNERGTWSFAPREPLMKTKRYTVTIAPAKLYKGVDEPQPDESKKVSTVISNLNKEQKPRKVHNLNKGNLIEMMQHKKVNYTASKTLEKVEHKHIEEVSSGLVKANITKDFNLIQKYENKTMNIPGKNLEDYSIDVRTLKDEDVILKENETKNDYDAYKSVKLIEMPVTLSKEDLRDSKNRTIDLSEITYPIDQNINNSLIRNNDNIDNHKTGQVLAFNDLEILLEKLVNQTEEFNVNLVSDYNNSDTTCVINNRTNDTLEDISQFDVAKPNSFYEVISLDNEDDNKELKEKSSLAGAIVKDSLNMGNVEISAVSDTNDLNEAKNFAENTVRSLVVGNLESLLNFMEQENDKQIMQQEKSFDDDKKEPARDIIYELTEKSSTKAPDSGKTISTVNETKDEILTEEPGQFEISNSTNLNSEEILPEVYESNRDLRSEEISAESFNDKDSNEVSKESVTDSSNLSLEDISNEARETSDESISDTLNNHTEELSNDALIDVSNNLTGEAISNESSSNIAAEELSNEYDVDKSNNLTDEVSNESIIETSYNFTDEEKFDVSSSNMSSEVLSEEASNEFITESSHNITGEDISAEWLVDEAESVAEELTPGKSVVSSEDPNAEEISVEGLTNRFKRSNNIIEKENLATTISGFKYTGYVKSLNHDLSYKNINS